MSDTHTAELGTDGLSESSSLLDQLSMEELRATWKGEEPRCEPETASGKVVVSVGSYYNHIVSAGAGLLVLGVGALGAGPVWENDPGVMGIATDADKLYVRDIVETMEPKPNKRATAGVISRLGDDVGAVTEGPWPDEGFQHLPLKNVRTVRVHLNRVGPLPPRIAYDPDGE